MSNSHLLSRIAAIRRQLMSAFAASATLSTATRGAEREFFVDLFLSQVLPLPFRFGTGDATDEFGSRSGQLDVVVEFPFLPSVPVAGGSRYRLYLAESIAAVIEVKSNVQSQWKEVEGTANQLHALKRRLEDGFSMNLPGGSRYTQSENSISMSGGVIQGGIVISPEGISIPGISLAPGSIPIFAVGYKGWQSLDSLAKHLEQSSVDGILVLENGLFSSNSRFGNVSVEGDNALWAFICALDSATKMLAEIKYDPRRYGEDLPPSDGA